MKSVEKTIRLAPFDDSYKEYLRKCEDSDINCLEGAIRSGKTIVNLVDLDNIRTIDDVDTLKHILI